MENFYQHTVDWYSPRVPSRLPNPGRVLKVAHRIAKMYPTPSSSGRKRASSYRGSLPYRSAKKLKFKSSKPGWKATPRNTVSKAQKSYAPIHSENKMKSYYHRSKAPYWVKRKARYQRKAFLRQRNYIIPMQHFSKILNLNSATTNNTQTWEYVPFLTMNGGIAGSNRYNQVSEILNNTSQDVVDRDEKRVYFKQCTMDLTVHNTNNTHDSIVTLYYIVCKKDLPIEECRELADGGVPESLSPEDLIYRNNELRLVDNNSGGTTTGADVIGVPLFNSHAFCRFFTINKVQKIQLGPGESFQTQLRKRNIGMFRDDDIDQLVAKKWKTGGIMIQHHGVWTGTNNLTSQLAIQATYLTNVKFYEDPAETPRYTSLSTVTGKTTRDSVTEI
jgi:hypothetical protein